MTVKQKEALQRRFDKAHARTARFVDAYKKLVNGKYYYAPINHPRGLITIDECTNEFQFLSHIADVADWRDNHHYRRPLYVKTYDNGFGYTKWREMTPAEWRRVDAAEMKILDAWEAENDLYDVLNPRRG